MADGDPWAIEGLELVHRGKVRDVWRLDAEHLLLVATDRVSAYDVVLPAPIPGKGICLTQIALFWFERLADRVPSHLVSADVDAMPPVVRRAADRLRGRTMLVREVAILPVECIVRGRLLGSAAAEYAGSGTVHGEPLPAGLAPGAVLDPPLFTPSTKAAPGEHDAPLDREGFRAAVGDSAADELEAASRALFGEGAAVAAAGGLVLADTKFEWGRGPKGELLLADEVLTPDSSRYWLVEDLAAAEPGALPPSYDKQVVRDWLDAVGFDRRPPAPPPPPEVVTAVLDRYEALYRRLTGAGAVPFLERES